MGKNKSLGKKELRALYATYGDKNLYNSKTFTPQIRNMTTGNQSSQAHHCSRCGTSIGQACYEKLQFAYCSTRVTRDRDGEHERVRCGERFCLRSDRCARHPRSAGHNEPFYRAAKGYEVDFSDFDDQEEEDTECYPDDDGNHNNDQVDRAAQVQQVEDIVAEGGHAPPEHFHSYWQEDAQKKELRRKLKRG